MQTNFYLHPHHGTWIVEFRQVGDTRWTTIGVYGTREAAEAAYDRLWR